MLVTLSYQDASGVEWGADGPRLRLAGARERPGLRYRGVIREPLVLREMLGALHDVVIADFRWRPPESRLQFERWLQYQLDRRARAERTRIERERRRYFEYLWATDRQLWAVLDPVCSVHPDQLVFEAFSRDGSAYARVGVDRSALDETDEVVCGTTNVDFSTGLYESLRRLRSIWRTELKLGADALEVATEGAPAHQEKKVELPDDWVRGFVQIGAAFLLPALSVELLPIHVYDLCRFLRLRRARTNPRALRWHLEPGRPVELVFEPWEHRMVLHGSRHTAEESRVIRVWGRRRLVLLERVIPQAEAFTFHLLGRGLPYFVTARSAACDFTLGLSGWTKHDWTSAARFSARVARRGRGGRPSPRPLAWLRDRFRGAPEAIAQACQLTPSDVHASLLEAMGQGQCVYDLLHGVYRYRPLFAQPLPAGVGLGSDEHEVRARELVAADAARVTGSRRVRGRQVISGRVVDGEHEYEPELSLDDHGSVVDGACGCWFAKQRGMKHGLCAHQHALLRVSDA